MQSWSVVIFFYNEAGNIQKVCKQAIDFLSPLPEHKKEIIFINDASTDLYLKQIKPLTQNKTYIKFINHEKNLGIGACLKRGYKMAQMENVCALPGDGQFDINELKAFRNIAPQTVISFFRTKNKQYSLLRKALNQTNKVINKLFFNIHIQDINWVKIYKTADIPILNLLSKSSYVESEIIYRIKKIKNYKIIQSPSFYLRRDYGCSKAVSPSLLKAVAKDIIRLLLNSRL